MAKKCTKCGKKKSEEEFTRDRKAPSGLTYWCKACYREYRRLHAARTTARRHGRSVKRKVADLAWADGYRHSDKGRNWRLKFKYGISLAVYDYIWDRQKGVCKICGLPNKDGKKLSVDHDHKTGKVRGLLCNRCNRGLGVFRDDPEILHKATEYLKGD